MKIGELVDSLSPLRKEIYYHVREYESENGRGPTVREVARHIGRVVSNTKYHLDKLCELGLLYRDRRGHVRVTGVFIDVVMPDENIEIVGADKLDSFHITKWDRSN